MPELKGAIIDLSHPVESGMPHWPDDPQTGLAVCRTLEQDGYRLNRLVIGEHSGTHIGAPSHFNRNQATVDRLGAGKLIVPAVKINLDAAAGENRDFLLQTEHILGWEEQHKKIESGLVLIHTGWSRFWSDPEMYFGLENGMMHFPGVSESAARFLAQQRGIIGLGIDTAGIDGGMSNDFAAGRCLAAHGIYHLENLANLNSLPDENFTVFIGALPIVNGHGSPCRVLAVIQAVYDF